METVVAICQWISNGGWMLIVGFGVPLTIYAAISAEIAESRKRTSNVNR